MFLSEFSKVLYLFLIIKVKYVHNRQIRTYIKTEIEKNSVVPSSKTRINIFAHLL